MGESSSLMGLMPIIVLFLLMWLLIFLPQSKREKQRQAMLNALKSGDEVETVSRVFGIVDSIEKDMVIIFVGLDDRDMVEIDKRKATRIRIHRDGIARVIKEEDKAKS